MLWDGLEMSVLTSSERKFVESNRVGRLATVDEEGSPHVVPVCFVCIDNDIYITIDEKQRANDPMPLKRIRNIKANPQIALTLDKYDEDWTRLAWVLVRGRADIVENCGERSSAQESLRRRYPQLNKMILKRMPVIAIRIVRVTSWGALAQY